MKKKLLKRKARPGGRRWRGWTGIRYTNSESPEVSVIIPVVNERATIAQVIRQAYRVHPKTEVIIVANGSTDGTRELAENLGAKVIWIAHKVGHDVGRSIGAAAAKGNILLFTDGDIVIRAELLIPLVNAVAGGIDVALNRYTGPTDKTRVHGVILAKHSLNIALSRPDLGGASLTTIPHALSRNALQQIGAEQLAVPPKALAAAVYQGLTVKAVQYIEVGKTNPRRRRQFRVDPLEPLIIGDHLEAMDWYLENTNRRANMTDLWRDRDIVR
ncbi:glycosyltransferase family 2 protein [Paenibacillus gansuensis]|uniref:Glycosyltransferase family 2 protein n=1 Tax=Paenibacillus gansuensis TaxID=306542 RepID=A0ABW5PAW1_9BACL